MSEKDPSNDLMLVTVAMLVLLAVVGGTWKYVTDRQPVSAEQNATIAEQGEAMTLRLQDELAKQLADRQVSEEQERIDSPLGQALLRKCVEWTEFHGNHPDASTKANRDAACDEYGDFISKGIVPD